MAEIPDPMSDCDTCRLNYWLTTIDDVEKAFKLAECKRPKLEHVN